MAAITSATTIKPHKQTFKSKEQYVAQCTIKINQNSKRIFKQRNSNNKTKNTRKPTEREGNKFGYLTENENE